MPTKTSHKAKPLFDHIPVAIVECDYSAVAGLKRGFKGAGSVRQFFAKDPSLVKTAFARVRVLGANRRALELCRARGRRDFEKLFKKMFTGSGDDLLLEQFVSLLKGSPEFCGEFRYKAPGQAPHDLFVRSALCAQGRKNLSRVVVTLQDITVWKRREQQLRKKAQLDGQTGLLNHNTITGRLEQELFRARRYNRLLSCLMVDIDHFKLINDKFGHPHGDQVLKKVAAMIRDGVRTVDLVGRYGGDEFLLIFPETEPQFARFAAERLQRIFASKMSQYRKTLSLPLSLSIGITGYPSKKASSSRKLITLADRAMYAAKKAGGNRIVVMS